MIQSTKVVTAIEMARIEKIAIEQGADPKLFMQKAGLKIALQANSMLKKISGKNVLLLIGKGNKGADAYVAGMELMQLGFQVRAVPLFLPEQCSGLNRHFASQFIGLIDKGFTFSDDDLIIDGLLGTGFDGQVEGALFQVIEAANQSKKPILSIDLPSGLNGTTGKVGGIAIQATHTATLGLAKTGLFIGEGWNYTGTLSVEDFGLSQGAIDEAKADFFLPTIERMELPRMERTHHKYERGFTIGFGGSTLFKGALKLSGRAAIHSGAGIVKLFSAEEIGAVEDALLCQVWDLKSWHESLVKAQAVFVGPGLGRSDQSREVLMRVLGAIEQPCVVDADALFFLTEFPLWPKQAILTPHQGEMLHLLGETRLSPEDLIKRCSLFVEEKNCILVLKGAPTFIFSPGKLPFVLVRGDPGMATAGSGDVLTGIIAALLAQRKEPLEAALLGVTLHALAGESAAREKTSYGYTATDLIDYLPQAFNYFLKGTRLLT